MRYLRQLSLLLEKKREKVHLHPTPNVRKKQNMQLLPTTNVESVFPLRNIILTSSFSNFCKMFLENRDAGTIHYILREIVVHVSHREDGSSKQANVKLHFKHVIV